MIRKNNKVAHILNKCNCNQMLFVFVQEKQQNAYLTEKCNNEK
jgi:hypothetical protein